jgi:hypothetical protein
MLSLLAGHEVNRFVIGLGGTGVNRRRQRLFYLARAQGLRSMRVIQPRMHFFVLGANWRPIEIVARQRCQRPSRGRFWCYRQSRKYGGTRLSDLWSDLRGHQRGAGQHSTSRPASACRSRSDDPMGIVIGEGAVGGSAPAVMKNVVAGSWWSVCRRARWRGNGGCS